MTAIPILMYHHVAPVPSGLRALRGLYVSPGAFSRQMRLLGWLGFRGLSMSDAMPYLRGEARGKVAVITFDDGYVDNLEHALPVLQRHGFSASCYAVSGALGDYNRWDEARTGVRAPIMTAMQLRAWRAAGMDVGAHTHSHVRLTQCDDAALQREVNDCRKALQDCTGSPVTQFCYPYGDHDDRVVASVREAGFSDATTTLRGRARAGGDPLRWPRVPISNRHLLAQVAVRLVSRYEDRHA